MEDPNPEKTSVKGGDETDMTTTQTSDRDEDHGHFDDRTELKSSSAQRSQQHENAVVESGIEMKKMPASLPSSTAAVSDSYFQEEPPPPPLPSQLQLQVPADPSSMEQQQVASPTVRLRNALHMENEEWADLSDSFQHNIAEPGRKALHNFFYPPRSSPSSSTTTTTKTIPKDFLHEESCTTSVSHLKARIDDPPLTNASAATTEDFNSNNTQTRTSPTVPLPHRVAEDSKGPLRPPLLPLYQPNTTPNQQQQQQQRRRRRRPPPPASSRIEEDPDVLEQDRQDREYVEKFWTAYDDIIILSLFTQLGILCRLGMATWFRIFDGVFHNESALFTNLPLNCLSCFFMGLLCSGESLMEIVATRFSPPRLQHDLHREASSSSMGLLSSPVSHNTGVASERRSQDDNGDDFDCEEREDGHFSFDNDNNDGNNHQDHTTPKRWHLRLRRKQRQRTTTPRRRPPTHRNTSWQPKDDNFQNELREVQLLALERRIRSSPCLVLFPVKKQDVDVVENYFHEGYQRRRDDSRRSSKDFSSWRGPGEVSSQESKEEIPVRMTHSDGGGFVPNFVEDTAFSFDNHDLSLDEEICLSGNASLDETDEEVQTLPSQKEEEFQDEIVTVDEDTKPNPTHSTRPGRDEATRTRTSLETANVATYHSNGRHGKVSNHVLAGNDDSDLIGRSYAQQRPHLRARQYGQVDGGNIVDYGTQDHPDLDQMITNVATDVSQKISRIRRVRLADGWDVGTTPEEKSADLMLGLRDGLCGALSSFSSWISSMVNLLRGGDIGKAFVGLVLGIQLPIVAYRFGQYVAVYIFVWRCRRETKRDNRRGYGIRLNMDDDDSEDNPGVVESVHSLESGGSISDGHAVGRRSKARRRHRTVQEEESETPSVRAIITAIFILALVAQTTSLNFFYEPEDRLVAMSLLFSPLGVLTRWRLSKFNSWRPSFPIGTFACNIGACALSGSLGSLLAGNPGPKERIALVAIIAGFGGTLSSVARFIVEILAGMDPILFRMDGAYYAVNSVICGLLISFLFTASVDWADSVE
jgi:fluoride ion exporter CrcB/FEX